MIKYCQKQVKSLLSGHSTFKENALLRETAMASFGSRSGEEVLELVQEAQGRGYIVSLENGLLTTPDMAKIELDIMAGLSAWQRIRIMV